jgi:hypothetical protein
MRNLEFQHQRDGEGFWNGSIVEHRTAPFMVDQNRGRIRVIELHVQFLRQNVVVGISHRPNGLDDPVCSSIRAYEKGIPKQHDMIQALVGTVVLWVRPRFTLGIASRHKRVPGGVALDDGSVPRHQVPKILNRLLPEFFGKIPANQIVLRILNQELTVFVCSEGHRCAESWLPDEVC